MPPSPTPDFMDSLALFTNGEFADYDSEDPELLLFTHGQFPRPSVTAPTVTTPTVVADGAVGTGRRSRRLEPTVVRRKDDIEAIAMALLFADEDDWF